MYAMAFLPIGISMILSAIGGSTIILFPLTVIWAFMYPYYVFNAYLRVSRGEKPTVKAFIETDLKENGVRFGLGSFLTQFFIFAWSMLFIIPGIMKQLSYAMTPYVLQDNPDMSALDAITESRKLMKGQKGRLIKLYCSYYIGPIVLSAVGVVARSFVLIYGLFSADVRTFAVMSLIAVIATFGFAIWSVIVLPRWYTAQALFYEDLIANS